MTTSFPTVTSDDVVKVLKKIGFRFKRQSGSSHAIYFRESDRKRTNVPIHPGRIIKRKTLKSILSDAGLTIDKFNDLRRK